MPATLSRVFSVSLARLPWAKIKTPSIVFFPFVSSVSGFSEGGRDFQGPCYVLLAVGGTEKHRLKLAWGKEDSLLQHTMKILAVSGGIAGFCRLKVHHFILCKEK